MTRHQSAILFSGFLLLRSLAIGTCAGDAASTTAVLMRGGSEQNPLLKPAAVPIAISLDTGVLAGVYTLETSHPRLAKVLYWSVIGTRGFAVYHNLRELRH